MAYRRTQRSSYGRGQRRSAFAGPGYRSSSRGRKRAPARRVSRQPQTVRIELVGMPANPISRSIPPSMAPKAPTKAKY